MIWKVLLEPRVINKGFNETRIIKSMGDAIALAIKRALHVVLRIENINSTIGTLFKGIVPWPLLKVQAHANRLFNITGLYQYADQVNSLSCLSHSLRLTCVDKDSSAIGQGS